MRVRKIYQRLSQETGTAAILTALTMAIALLFTAMAVDIGRLYLEKSRIQKAIDAAVLAGAYKLGAGEAAAIAEVEKIAEANAVPLASYDAVNATEQAIRIVKTRHIPLTMTKLLLTSSSVDFTVTAQAQVNPVSALLNGFVPIAVENNTNYFNGSPQSFLFPDQEGGPVSGNAACIYLENQHSSDNQFLAEQIQDNYHEPVHIGDQAYVKSISSQLLFEALTQRIQKDSSRSSCQRAEAADTTCARVMFLPVIQSWQQVRSNETNIVGFTAFWIDTISQEPGAAGLQTKMTGRFISAIAPGRLAVGDGSGISFGLYAVKLTE